jgi:hypothetical protein
MLRLDSLSIGAVALVVIHLMLFEFIVGGISVVWGYSWHIIFLACVWVPFKGGNDPERPQHLAVFEVAHPPY